MALWRTFSPSDSWCDKNGTQMAMRLNFSPSERWCDKWNTDGAETDFLPFWVLVWEMEHRWSLDWFSHLLSAGVTKGTQMALRLTFSPSEPWCDKRITDGAETDFLAVRALAWQKNTDGTETDFLTFWALVWQKEHRWRWWQQLIPQWWPPLSDLSS